MNGQEIIEMARQAGFPFNKYGLLQGDDEGEINADEMFEAFAKLVATKEREACAKVCEGLNLYGGSESRQLQRATLKDCAYAIRARDSK